MSDTQYFIISYIVNGHGSLLREHIQDYTKLPQGPLCPPLRSLGKPNTDSSSDKAYDSHEGN